MDRELVIAVMAGGEGRRMGTDKTALRYGDATLLEHAVSCGLDTGLPTVVVGRSRPEQWSTEDIPFLADAIPGQGPIGGVAVALAWADGKAVLAVAADLPKMKAEALSWLVERWSDRGTAKGVAVKNGDQLEPLFAIYGAELAGLVRDNIGRGRRSLHAVIASGGFQIVEAPPEVAACLVNVNTPEEWRTVTGKALG